MESKIRIGIRDDWPELTAIINKAIHSIIKDRINALKKKWISQKGYESIFTLDELHWLSSPEGLEKALKDGTPSEELLTSLHETFSETLAIIEADLKFAVQPDTK